jgi:hypothetical protein
MAAGRDGRGEAVFGVLTSPGPTGIDEAVENVQELLAVLGGVEQLVQRLEADALLIEVGDQFGEVLQGPAEPEDHPGIDAKKAVLDSGDQRNGAGEWGICGSDGAAGDVGSDEGRPVEALASW